MKSIFDVSPTELKPIYECRSNRDGHILGYIGWEKRFEEYAYTPCDITPYREDCLADIAAFIKQLMDLR